MSASRSVSVSATPQASPQNYKPLESIRSSSGISSILSSSESENLFSRISNCHYSSKLEYLLNVFEFTVNFKESESANKCKVNANISLLLDEKKRIFSMLKEMLSEICREEMQKYNLDECNITYIPQVGFLLVIKEEYFGDDSNCNNAVDLNETDVERSSPYQSGIDQRRAEFEFINELKFAFKSNDLIYYKSIRMLDLDQEYGDIACDINDIEAEIMDSLQDDFIKYSHYYANLIDYCAELDTLLSFAMVAKENNYIKPVYSINESLTESFMIVKEGRHPLLEIVNDNSIFVPNDIFTGDSSQYNTDKNKTTKIKILTAPNASGKTVYLKQVGLILYMSMIGSYVPASEAVIGDFDRIYTRINSSDSIVQGKSTFTVDVQQVADALNGSSPKSLILMDEFGKGTLASDGQAILAALIRRWINSSDSAHVFISTHYYEMFQQDNFLFNKNREKMEYLTFEYLFDDENKQKKTTEDIVDYENFQKKIIYLYKIRNGLTR